MIHDYVDAHVHVWETQHTRFPYDSSHNKVIVTPAAFNPERFLPIARSLDVRRAVLVQMSFYGNDNSYMLDAMRRYPSVFSGIGVVDCNSVSLAEQVAELAGAGVRGFRVAKGGSPFGWLETPGMCEMWRLAGERNLAICPLTDPGGLSALNRMCMEFPGTTVVIDHMARIGMDGVLRDSDLKALCNLSRHQRVHVKVSAFYALGRKTAPHDDLAPLVQALYYAYGPQRLMWGSDSPFQIQPPYTYAQSLDFVLFGLSFLRPQDKEWILGKSAEKIFF